MHARRACIKNYYRPVEPEQQDHSHDDFSQVQDDRDSEKSDQEVE